MGSMVSRSAVRAGASRVVFVVAALACVATSPPRWHLTAKTPPAVGPTPGRGELVVVEASQEPEAQLAVGERWHDRAFPAGSASGWPGQVEFFVPPGGGLAALSIGGRCTSGGGACSNCTPPPGAFVKVLRSDPVDTWRLEATGPTQTTELQAKTPGGSIQDRTYRIEYDAPPGVSRVEVVWPAGSPSVDFLPSTWASTPAAGKRVFEVYWHAVDGKKATLTWAPRVITEGFCRSAGPCAPPPGAAVRIVDVKLQP